MNYKFFLFSLFASLCIISCEKDDHDHGCHDCHIAYMETGGEIQVDLGEFCDDDLENIEANGYTLAEDVVVGDVSIPAGFYPASDIHCGEHHDDHDDHDDHD